MESPEYKARAAAAAAEHRAAVMAQSDVELRRTQFELAHRVLPDMSCEKCLRIEPVHYKDYAKSDAENTARLDRNEQQLVAMGFVKAQLVHCAGYRYEKLCDPCKVRQPWSWVRDVPLARFREFLAVPKRSSAWCLDELNELLPPKGGFEHL